MAGSDTLRSVSISRTAPGRFSATNVRGGRMEFGSGDDEEFTPVELLLVAIGGCSGVDVDLITGRRAQPDSFVVDVQAEKIRDEGGNRLTDVVVTFHVAFPSGEAGDAARAVLPDAVKRSHDRLCTVSRTVELPTPVTSVVG
jgi:putative redox protein